MMHKFAFEAVDQIFHDITQIDELFGEKTFIFEEDFHQILPVIPRAFHTHIVLTSLHQSTI